LCGTERDSALRAERYCVLYSGVALAATGDLGDVYRLLDHEGKQRIAITIGEAGSWARLAKRGKTLFLLTPTPKFHRVDRGVQCECRGGPVVVSMSGFIKLGLAFVLDDLPAEIQPIIVPVVDDFVEWQCKMILVRNEHMPHRAVHADAAHALSNHCPQSGPDSWSKPVLQ
jgi:hypothetical protein